MSRHLTDETIDQLLEAPEEAPEEAAHHLEECSLCQAELRLARRVDDALAAVPRMVAPPALLEGVMTAVVAARAQRRRIVAISATVAVVGLAAVVVWLVSGGAATVALQAVELTRALGVVSSVGAALWHAFQVPLVVAAFAVLLLSSAALRRVVARAAAGHAAPAYEADLAG